MNLKLLVFCVLMCDVFCHHSYQLPDGEDNKSLNVTLHTSSNAMLQFTIECFNYDSLKFFEVRLDYSDELALHNGILLDFIKCFNNATDNENYNYGLRRWFNSLPYFNSETSNGYPLIVKHDEYAEVNSDVLFNDFDFRKFSYVTFQNLGFRSTTFLNHLYCTFCKFENIGRIDFNDFGDSIADAYRLEISFSKLINFDPNNVKKWNGLEALEICDFDLDNYNTFNVPDLFRHNVKLSELKVEKSQNKITLHEHVFRELNSLNQIVLQKLQLDHIPKDLFKNLKELRRVILSYNNIKTIDPNTFQTNVKLSYVSFSDNPFYTEPHDKLEAFNLSSTPVHFQLGNFTTHTFDLLEQLIKNTGAGVAAFQSFLIDKFNVTDFTRVYIERSFHILQIVFQDGEPDLDLAQIKSFGNITRPSNSISNDYLSAIINIQFSGDTLCHDCDIIKQLFPHFLQNYYTQPGFFFEASRLFIRFDIPDACKHLDEHFEKSFDENCPTNCTCKISPLLDKVKIDCSNKNLTKLPHIPYPAQFDKIESIEMNFENNSISVLRSAYQDQNVLRKLSALNFKNNHIASLEEEADLLKHIWSLNICGNPIVSTSEHQLKLDLGSGANVFDNLNCYSKIEYPEVGNYIENNKSNVIDGYLNSLPCN